MMFKFQQGGTGLEPIMAQMCAEHFACEGCTLENGQPGVVQGIKVLCNSAAIRQKNTSSGTDKETQN